MTEQVTVQRLIPAPAEAIFDLLADPGRHHEIDGSGTIVGARSAGERRLALGDSFGMDMDWGVNYATKNVVVEFEENRRIAWQTWPLPLSYVLTGRIWRRLSLSRAARSCARPGTPAGSRAATSCARR